MQRERRAAAFPSNDFDAVRFEPRRLFVRQKRRFPNAFSLKIATQTALRAIARAKDFFQHYPLL
jgi:hypothetical protein